MRDSDPRPAPPIPPRRLKRRNKTDTNVCPTDGVTESALSSTIIRLEHRPRLPPPPPPQRGLQKQEIRPQILPRPEIKGNIIPGSSNTTDKCQSRSIIEDKLIIDGMEEAKPSLSTFGTALPLGRGNDRKLSGEEPTRRKREKVKISRPNEYPPLFFTLEDFHDVMSNVENSSSRTLKNMTTFEPIPKPRMSKILNNDLPSDTAETGNVLFRVTTTNLPFEKSLSESIDVRNDPDHFIFEEYVDRRQIPAKRKPKASNTKLVLFGDDTFDRDDEDRSISTSHTASRVRFLVDSPTRGKNCEKIMEYDSLQNIDSLPTDFLPSHELIPAVKLTLDQDEDEFGDVPFDSLLNYPASSLCVDPSEDSTSSKTDFQTILVTATVEPIPLAEELENLTEINGEGIHSDIQLAEANKAFISEEEIIQKYENIHFETEELKEDVKCDSLILLDVRDEEMETMNRNEEENEKMTGDESLRNSAEVENVRRNSFLMNMLQGDETDDRVLCKVVATHPKTPIHGSCKIDGKVKGVGGGRGGGKEPSAAVEAKSKLLGELSSSFSAIKLKPVNNNVVEMEEKQSASDLKVDSMNVSEESKRKITVNVERREDKDNVDDVDDDNVAKNDIKYKLNCNLDSALDRNVVKCKLKEEPIEESINIHVSLNEPQDRSDVCSQKTDDINIDNEENKNYDDNINSVTTSLCDDVEKIQMEKTKIKDEKTEIESNNNNDDDGKNHVGMNMNKKILEVASRSSVDKCAIVLKCNNNNDNNAMTPVDVSYDQSPNNVSIIPGSVRSFVKFYEIQGETSVGLNSIDIASVPKIKVEATGNNTADYLHEIQSKDHNIVSYSESGGPVIEIENDIKYTIVTRKPVMLQKQQNNNDNNNNDNINNNNNNNKSNADKKQIVNQRLDKFDKSTCEPISLEREQQAELYKMDGKRDAQFHADSTLIGSKSIIQDEQEGTQRRDPGSSFSSSKQEEDNLASEISSGQQDDSTKDVVRSGTTNKSVPKSTTSTINEQFTFYCTV